MSNYPPPSAFTNPPKYKSFKKTIIIYSIVALIILAAIVGTVMVVASVL